jgi:N utilization substance protein A
MENLALIDSFSEFKDDKLIDRVTLMAILEDVFRNALKKKYGSDDNFDIINPDGGYGNLEEELLLRTKI